MDTKKKRLAICVSGELRFFDLTSIFYSYLPKLLPDWKVDIFLTFWDSGRPKENYSCITASKCLDESKVIDKDRSAKYAYSLFHCHELRRTHGTYDLVIQTRSDLVFGYDFIECINDIKLPASPYVMYVPGSIEKYNGTLARPGLSDDNLAFASPLVMDKYSMMYYDGFVTNEYTPKGGFHVNNLSQLLHRKLTYKGINISRLIIRNIPPAEIAKVPGNRQVNYQTFKESINKYGIEDFFTIKRIGPKWRNT